MFGESGFKATVNHRLPLVRGEVDVDVYVVDEEARPRPIRLIVECKNWQTRVPKTVVHALRTVVSDSGANGGIVVSRVGYQSGALDAAESANVEVLTWEDVQRAMVPRWTDRFFTPRVGEITDAFNDYTEPINSRIFRKADELPAPSRARFEVLRQRHMPLAALVLPLLPAARLLISGPGWPRLPLRVAAASSPDLLSLPDEVLDATALRPLLDGLERACVTAVNEFDEVFGGRA